MRKDLIDQRLTDAIHADLERKARLLAVRDVGLQTFDDDAFEVVDLTRAAKALGVLGLAQSANGALLPPKNYGNRAWDAWGAKFLPASMKSLARDASCTGSISSALTDEVKNSASEPGR